MYLRAIQCHSGRAHSGNALIDTVLQDTVLLPMIFTRYVYHVGQGNEKRSMVHNGLIPGGFSSTKTCRYAVFFTVVDPMDEKNEASGRPFATSHEQESRFFKILGNNNKTQYSGAIYYPLKKEDCDFTKQGLMH